eukprot:scaffold5892_cov147-Amphora_coffeaeformis.AAC.1
MPKQYLTDEEFHRILEETRKQLLAATGFDTTIFKDSCYRYYQAQKSQLEPPLPVNATNNVNGYGHTFSFAVDPLTADIKAVRNRQRWTVWWRLRSIICHINTTTKQGELLDEDERDEFQDDDGREHYLQDDGGDDDDEAQEQEEVRTPYQLEKVSTTLDISRLVSPQTAMHLLSHPGLPDILVACEEDVKVKRQVGTEPDDAVRLQDENARLRNRASSPTVTPLLFQLLLVHQERSIKS